jgi:hypothetical protein
VQKCNNASEKAFQQILKRIVLNALQRAVLPYNSAAKNITRKHPQRDSTLNMEKHGVLLSNREMESDTQRPTDFRMKGENAKAL